MRNLCITGKFQWIWLKKYYNAGVPTEIEKIDNTCNVWLERCEHFHIISSISSINAWGYIFSYILFLYIILISVIDADLSCMRVKLQSWAMLRTAERKKIVKKISVKSNTSQTKKNGSQNKLKAIQNSKNIKASCSYDEKGKK